MLVLPNLFLPTIHRFFLRRVARRVLVPMYRTAVEPPGIMFTIIVATIKITNKGIMKYQVRYIYPIINTIAATIKPNNQVTPSGILNFVVNCWVNNKAKTEPIKRIPNFKK